MNNVFLTKFSDKIFYKKEGQDKIYNDFLNLQDNFVISHNFTSENSVGIFSVYSFLTGEIFNDNLWNRYKLNKEIFSKVKKIKYYQKQEHYGFLPEAIMAEFAEQYIQFIENIYNEFIKDKDFKFNKNALLNFEKINSVLYMLSQHNPFLIIKADIESYRQHIYSIDNFYFLKVNYTMNTSNGLITSYDRSMNNISKNDEIRDCIVSRFGKKGKILLADYNAFQPRILFSIAGYDVNTEDDFYKDISNKLKINAKRDEIKLNIFRTLYSGYENKTIFENIELLKSKLLNEYSSNGYISSITGRRKYIEKDKLSNKLINTFVQLAQADIIIEFLIKINKFLSNKRTKLISFISDCFIFDVHENENDELKEFLKNNLQKSIYLNGFLKLNFKEGKSWAEC